MNLLVNQFGVKPSVLFPKVPKKSPDSRQVQRKKNESSLSSRQNVSLNNI